MTYNKQLDGFRFIAIFSVFIAHWIAWVIPWRFFRTLPYGAAGVILFFVLSGYLITRILLDFKIENEFTGKSNLKSIKAFYIRRTLRIFPIYYITIFVLLLINMTYARSLFPWLVSYTLNIKEALGADTGFFNHFWSLAVEEQFYLFWTFVIVFSPTKYLLHVILLFIIFSIALNYFLTFGLLKPWAANSLVITNMHKLGLGGLIAYWSVYSKDQFMRWKSRYLKILLLTLLLIFMVFYNYIPQDNYPNFLKFLRELIVVMVCGLIIILAVKNSFKGLIKRFLETRFIIYLGRISYCMYVIHLFMAPFYFSFICKYIHIPYSDLGSFIILFVMTVILASLSWFLIEKPINNLKRFFKYT